MPHFKRKHINKEEYKDILKKSVTKVSQSKDNDINPNKIKKLIEGYVERCNLFYANKMTKKDFEITTTYEKDYLYIVQYATYYIKFV